MSDKPTALMTDIAFGLLGGSLARDHRYALAEAVEDALPWLMDLAGAGVHRLNLSAGGGSVALLSGRTRLTLRVPRARAAEVAKLEGSTLTVGASTLLVGAPQPRGLLPYGTLYAHLVASDHNDEAVFMQAMAAELSDLGVRCRAICGRYQVLESGALQGFSLMLDGLSPEASMRVLEAGLGQHRRLGCGLFVPHKSAAAVGTPA